MGLYQPKLAEYPKTRYTSQKHARRFQYSLFKKFSWLEYSLKKDAVFCFPCFIFEKKIHLFIPYLPLMNLFIGRGSMMKIDFHF